MRRGLAGALAGVLWATPGHALEATFRLGVPYFVDPGVGGLFPGGQRLGGGAEWRVSGPWSLSLDSHWLHQDWGTTRYTLSLTPLLLRHRLPLGQAVDAPYVTVGLGGAAMTLFGGDEGFRIGLGPAFAAGLGLPLGKFMFAQLELQQGAIQSIRYVGFGLSLGMRLGAPPAAVPMQAAKPPLPRGQLLRLGTVSQVEGGRIHLALDDLPYQLQPGDILVVYYQDRLPIKVAKVRIASVDSDGRTATGTLLAATEAIRRGYLLGTL